MLLDGHIEILAGNEQRSCTSLHRWTMTARVKALPLAQNLVFTGTSTYHVAGGLLVSQRDVWDAISNNDYLSVRCLYFCMSPARHACS
jgi:hypothetical protein